MQVLFTDSAGATWAPNRRETVFVLRVHSKASFLPSVLKSRVAVVEPGVLDAGQSGSSNWLWCRYVISVGFDRIVDIYIQQWRMRGCTLPSIAAACVLFNSSIPICELS